MIENVISKRYAKALSDSIEDEGLLHRAQENLRAFREAFEADRQLGRFFSHPGISVEKKNDLVREFCDRVQAENVVRNLMAMLTERKKVLFLKNIADYFDLVVDERLNQVRVHVTSAHPLTKDNIDKLKTGLKRILGKTVLIDTREDASLIGGIQLQVGDQVADATIKNRLAILKRTIEKEEVA
ncbi:ATP synthase F1 subunit delta [Candidatus Nitromaritima sp. SCGC AAA799-C22]|nr:ATP synthase F1 subunit delta [Candidatus Nitromaritima sp. SCGC AAA799-C22]